MFTLFTYFLQYSPKNKELRLNPDYFFLDVWCGHGKIIFDTRIEKRRVLFNVSPIHILHNHGKIRNVTQTTKKKNTLKNLCFIGWCNFDNNEFIQRQSRHGLLNYLEMNHLFQLVPCDKSFIFKFETNMYLCCR